MQTVIKKWGNSASVRIPAAVLEAAKLQVEAAVDIREEGGRIIIEAIQPAPYDLDALIADITPSNLHGEVDFGPSVGKEAW